MDIIELKQKEFESVRDKTDYLYENLSNEIKRNQFFKEFTTSYAQMIRLEAEIIRLKILKNSEKND